MLKLSKFYCFYIFQSSLLVEIVVSGQLACCDEAVSSGHISLQACESWISHLGRKKKVNGEIAKKDVGGLGDTYVQYHGIIQT